MPSSLPLPSPTRMSIAVKPVAVVPVLTAVLSLGAASAFAAPHVWLDTERGPIVLELDPVRAPLTSAHFLQAVEAGFYDGLVFHRTIPDFMIQSGGIDGRNQVRTRSPNPTVASERNNGLTHVPGAVAIALPSANSQPIHDGGTTQFFINTVRNAHLDGQYTVFAHVVHGLPLAKEIGAGATYVGSPNVPFRPTLIEQAVVSDGFPVLPLHTGAWYDPANSGRGLSIEVAQVDGGDGSPLLVAYWYDYFGGQQIWMNGAAPFAWGDSEVTVSLARTSGGEFGEAFDPSLVAVDADFGELTVRFHGCNSASFRYTTALGDGQMEMVRLSVPDGETCVQQ